MIEENPKEATRIRTLEAVNGIAFGARTGELLSRFGEPDHAMENYTGELELFFDNTVYRTFNDRFVEATIPDDRSCVIDGVSVLSVFDWLADLSGTVDLARFRISTTKGIAYDYRFPDSGSITVFEEGRWDVLLRQAGL
jgi:hypothetical protein